MKNRYYSYLSFLGILRSVNGIPDKILIASPTSAVIREKQKNEEVKERQVNISN